MASAELLLLLMLAGADPEAPIGLRFAKGDELVYAGTIIESSDLADQRYRKTHGLDLRLLCLERDETASICAVLTVLKTEADPRLAVGELVKPAANKPFAVARLDLVRIDSQGRAEWLEPAGEEARLDRAVRKAIPVRDATALPDGELGFLVPSSGIVAGAEGTWNGRRCRSFLRTTASDHFDDPAQASAGWQCKETFLVGQGEPFASEVTREGVRRLNRETVAKISISYRLQPGTRLVGQRFDDARRDCLAGWKAVAEFNAAVAKPIKTAEFAARAAQWQRMLDDGNGRSEYRAALATLQRRALALASGAAPYVPPVAERIAPPVVGRPAPDFTAADVEMPANRFRLNAAKGKPVVLVFFKPNSVTSAEALTVAEALARRHADTISVVPLALGPKPADGAAQRKDLKFKIPVFDGTAARTAYAVETFPRFHVVDAAGALAWSFEAGVGAETGFLVNEAVAAALAKP